MNNEIISLAEKLIKFKTISHHYKEIKECASVILHSYSGGGYHAEDEWVDIKSVKQLYNIQKRFVEKFSRKR